MGILNHSILLRICASAVALLLATMSAAQDVRITTFKSESTFTLNGRSFTITRNQDTSAQLSGAFALTSRACPPNCLQPISLGNGVATLGEREVIAFLEGSVSDGRGLLLDSRSQSEYIRGTIPSAVNVPFSTVSEENRFLGEILQALGATPNADGALDFSNAMSLVLFSGGVWSADAPTAVASLLAAGYPPEKLFYYRGGMQAWLHVGLTVQLP